LVAVGTLEVSGLPRISALRILYIRRAPMPGVVAAARTLDLDHLGPKVAQYLPGPGPGQHTGKIEHADMRECTGHINPPDECLALRDSQGARAAPPLL